MAEDEATSRPASEKVTDPAQRPTRPPRRRTVPTPDDPNTDSLETRKGAGAAGVGGGTLIAVIASALPDGLTKTVLIWLAPAATITFSALWIYARGQVVAYLDDRDANRDFKAARKAIEQGLSNQHLTPQQRAEFEGKQFDLDQMIIERRMSKATAHAKK